jgi:ankyrin repeat protein
MNNNSKFINMSCDDYYEKPININNNKLPLFNQLLFSLVVNNEKKDLIIQLKNNKNNINIQDKDGDTPLHIAMFLCNYEIIKILLDFGADINIKDKWGQTAVHRLYFGIKDDNINKIIKLLEDRNINFSAIDKFGNTVLHITLKQMIKFKTPITIKHKFFINKFKSLIPNDIKNKENYTIKDLLEIINYID